MEILWSSQSDFKILDVYEFESKDISELSALGFDGNTLYALSDYGELHHLSLKLESKKIKGIAHLSTYKLKNKKARVLKRISPTLKGLCIKTDIYIYHLKESIE